MCVCVDAAVQRHVSALMVIFSFCACGLCVSEIRVCVCVCP